MEQTDKNTDIPVKDGCLEVMRYFSILGMTLWLIVLLSTSLSDNEWHFNLWWIMTVFCFFISLPVLGFWIYSFVKAIRHRTEKENILLGFHILDLLLLGLSIYFLNRPALKCDYDIMAKHYEQYGAEMRKVAKFAQEMIPDCGGECVYEFGDANYESHNPVHSPRLLNNLREKLEAVGCIGIETDNQGKRNCAILRFRRIGMGMYSFRLYDNALTKAQKDSINADERFIVYNDNTVFEFGGGAIGTQYFLGKEEVMERKRKR